MYTIKRNGALAPPPAALRFERSPIGEPLNVWNVSGFLSNKRRFGLLQTCLAYDASHMQITSLSSEVTFSISERFEQSPKLRCISHVNYLLCPARSRSPYVGTETGGRVLSTIIPSLPAHPVSGALSSGLCGGGGVKQGVHMAHFQSGSFPIGLVPN